MGRVSRRAVLGAAWSVPVLSLAVAAPAAAASGGGDTSMFWDQETVASGASATLYLRLPASHEPFPTTSMVNVAPTGRIGDWYIRSVASSWPPDGAHEYPYLAWRSNGLAEPGGLYSFTMSFRQITAGSTAVFAPSFFTGITLPGPSIVAQ